jgi:hypothetical protein
MAPRQLLFYTLIGLQFAKGAKWIACSQRFICMSDVLQLQVECIYPDSVRVP